MSIPLSEDPPSSTPGQVLFILVQLHFPLHPCIFSMDCYPSLVSWVQYCFMVFLPLVHAISHPGNSPVPRISQIPMEHLMWVNESCDYRHSLFLAWAPHTFKAWFLQCLSITKCSYLPYTWHYWVVQTYDWVSFPCKLNYLDISKPIFNKNLEAWS